MKKRLRWALVTAIALPLLNACGGGGDELLGHVRLVNATSEYAGLDLYTSSKAVSTGAASYGVGGYGELDPDDYTFTVRNAGSSATLATTSQSTSKGDYNTLVAYTSGGTLTTTYLSDDEDDPSSGTAKLRVFNTDAVDAGNVDVYVVDTACSTSSTAAATATNVSALQDSYAEITAAKAGTSYHVCVFATGSKSDLRLDIPAMTFTDQQIATLILTRSAGGVLLNAMLLNERGAATVAKNSSARVRVAVSTTTAATVSASVNGSSLGSGYASPAVGSYKLVTAGDLSATVTIDSIGVPATGLVALPGGDYTLLVAGSSAAPSIALITDDNTVSTSTANTVKLRLVNGLNGYAGTVNLTDDYDDVGNGAVFANASSVGLVPPSTELARLEATSGGTSLALLEDTTLVTGKVYTFFLMTDVTSTTGAKAILKLDH